MYDFSVFNNIESDRSMFLFDFPVKLRWMGKRKSCSEKFRCWEYWNKLTTVLASILGVTKTVIVATRVATFTSIHVTLYYVDSPNCNQTKFTQCKVFLYSTKYSGMVCFWSFCAARAYNLGIFAAWAVLSRIVKELSWLFFIIDILHFVLSHTRVYSWHAWLLILLIILLVAD